MDLTRRNFLKVAGVAGATGGPILSGNLKAFAQAPQGSKPILWDKTLYQSCGVCGSTCGMIAHVKNGRIRWIEGNPAETLGGDGKVCVKGASAVRDLYNPDRLKSPLKRTNPRKGKNEDPGWIKISWDEAFKTVGAAFNKSIKKYGPQSIVLFSRKNDPTVRLKKAIGTPNQVEHHDTCYSSHDIAWHVMATGKGRSWTMDIENAKYILSFGWDMPGKSKLSQCIPFMKAKEKGAKVVVFDPRFSFTASKADEWFPIKPATDLAVVLTMTNVIISENLYNKEYVENCTYGLDQLAQYVRQYTPEWASKISEVPADDIARIARELAKTRPAIIPTHKRDPGGPCYANSFTLAQAEIILSALIGSIEAKGGFFIDRKFKFPKLEEFAPVEYPKMTEKRRIDGEHLFPIANAKGEGNFGHVAGGMLADDPYPVRAGIALAYNLLSFPNPDTMEEAIKKMDFFAVVDIVPSEMCQMADIVLPETHFLERSGYVQRGHHAMWPQLMLREGIPALYDGKGWSAIVSGILKAMGKSEFIPDWKAYSDACLEAAGTSIKAMKDNKGVWEEKKEPKGKTEFETPTKKIELYSTVLEKEGYEPLPSWHEPFDKPSEKYPFRLLTHHLMWQFNGKLANDPYLMELQHENLLHLHPETAGEIGVKQGGYALVDSPTGKSLKIKVHTTQGIRKDCVMTEHFAGHWSKGLNIAYGKGTNEGDLLPERHLKDTLKFKSYLPCFSSYITDVCVNVRKA